MGGKGIPIASFLLMRCNPHLPPAEGKYSCRYRSHARQVTAPPTFLPRDFPSSS